MHKHISQKHGLSYKVIISDNFSKFQSVFLSTKAHNKKILIITDNNVKKLYLKTFTNVINKFSGNVYVFSMKNNEKNKNLTTCGNIYKLLLKERFSRKDLIIAFGGGCVSDIAGFVAGTYMRGIDYIIVPTTYLSMCDSAIGSKTAINHSCIKNSVGIFKDPKFVYINYKLALSLKNCDFISGLAEAIKHALVDDYSFYKYIEKNKELISKRNMSKLKYVVKKSLEIKSKYIVNDPFDYKERHVLNFGHTFGHAIEACEGYKYSHGECVAIGMKMAMELNNFTEIKRVLGLLDYFGLKTDYIIKNKRKISRIIATDKKNHNGKIEFILLKKIGKAYIKELKI